jgi:hypothetical protein
MAHTILDVTVVVFRGRPAVGGKERPTFLLNGTLWPTEFY